MKQSLKNIEGDTWIGWVLRKMKAESDEHMTCWLLQNYSKTITVLKSSIALGKLYIYIFKSNFVR